jgi:hypothetical protein
MNDIYSTLNDRYNDLKNSTKENEIKLYKITIFRREFINANILSFLKQEFLTDDKNLDVKGNYQELDNISIVKFLHIVKQNVDDIKNKIFHLKRMAEKQSPS